MGMFVFYWWHLSNLIYVYQYLWINIDIRGNIDMFKLLYYLKIIRELNIPNDDKQNYSFCKLSYWLKSLDTTSLEPNNQTSIIPF